MAERQETAAQSLAAIPSNTDPALLNPTQRSSSPKKRFRSPDPKSLSPASTRVAQATGFAEMAEAKRRKTAGKDTTTPAQTSRNPAFDATNALTGGQATSKPGDAPNKLTTSSATSTNAPSVTIPETGISSAQTSPTTAGSDTVNMQQVASPGAMDRDEEEGNPNGNKAFSYPGPLLNIQMDPKRGMSLPGSESRDSSKAGAKKHKCPYCETVFTRHHNLKSHLLTHSHEKPYLCQTCDSRFRRLHDLKRHTKLHTGERPHVCPKCNRKFARGDALARHAKGQGGCAGRRSSVGEYANEDDLMMEGINYTDAPSHEPEGMDDEEAGGAVPSIRHHAPAQSTYRSDTGSSFGRVGSTYPPIAARANMGLHPSGSTNQGPYSGSYPPAGGVFPTSQMTESPKPLSPGNPMDRPSMSSAYPPPPRRGTRNTPPPSLPPPAAGNQLPSLSGLAPPDSRYTLHSTPGVPGPSPTLPHPASGTFAPHSASNSLSSHGTGPHGSGERGNMGFSQEDRLWAVIKSLEAKVDALQEEVRMLRAQQTSPTGTVSSGPSLPPPNR